MGYLIGLNAITNVSIGERDRFDIDRKGEHNLTTNAEIGVAMN